MRPRDLVERLRTEVPAFENRVHGLIGRDDALDIAMDEKVGLAVPCAYVAYEGEAPAEDRILDTLDDSVEVQFSVTVIVDGRADASGLDASERLMVLRDAVQAALRGWAPSTQFGALIYQGTTDAPAYNRAYGAVAYLFAGQYYLSAP